MAGLYITEQGAVIRKTSRKIVVEKEDAVLLEVPEFKIDRIVILGNVQLTTQAIKFILDSNIDTSFLTSTGKLKGKLITPCSKNVFIRLSQYEKYKNEEFKLRIAKTIIRGKIRNKITMLNRFMRNHPETDFSEIINNIRFCENNLENKMSINGILGVEGKAAALYFNSFSEMIRKNFEFDRRQQHPSLNPVNSLLNLGYTLITNEITSFIQALGMDPFIGYLHSPEYGRPSLALDIVEEFRQPIVDRLTLELVNKEIFTEDDFEQKDNKVRIKKKSLKKYFTAYERKLRTEFKDEQGEGIINFRKKMFDNVSNFSKTIQFDAEYVPFSLK